MYLYCLKVYSYNKVESINCVIFQNTANSRVSFQVASVNPISGNGKFVNANPSSGLVYLVGTLADTADSSFQVSPCFNTLTDLILLSIMFWKNSSYIFIEH